MPILASWPNFPPSPVGPIGLKSPATVTLAVVTVDNFMKSEDPITRISLKFSGNIFLL